MQKVTLGERMRNQETMEPNVAAWPPLPPAAHDILSASHGDAAIDAVTQGSLIVGNATPAWDELVRGVAHFLLKMNAGATDPVWAAFDWDDIAAAAGADMVHTHDAAGEGGTLDHLIAEGPDIDLIVAAGVTTVGRGGDTVLLFDSGGNPLAEFVATSAGLDAASAAAAANDVVWIPAMTIPDNHALTAGVRYIGVSRWASILTGEITMGNVTTLETCSIIRAANDANDLKGVIGPAAGEAAVSNCKITCTQAGAGDAYAVSVEDAGDLDVWVSYLNGDSTGGAGYGGHHGLGAAGDLYVHACRIIGSTNEFNV